MDNLWPLVYVGAGLVVLLLLRGLYNELVARIVVHEYEVALLYRDGKFIRRLGPGSYRLWTSRWETRLVDQRQTVESVAGQEVLTADEVALKVSLNLTYSVADPEKALHVAQDYQAAVHVAAQDALRSAIAALPVDELLAQRGEIAQRVKESLAAEIEPLGLELHSVAIKDFIFPGDLKRIFAQVIAARKESQAMLERARGESAALRNLANGARVLQDNPGLLRLRTLQALEQMGGDGGKVVVKLPASLFAADETGAGPTNGSDE